MRKSRRVNRKSRSVSRRRKSQKSRRISRRRSRKSQRSIKDTFGYKEYIHNGMTNLSFRKLPKQTKINIVKEALKNINPKMALSTRKRVKRNMLLDLKDLQKRSHRFGYSHDQGPKVYNAYMDDGILLADNAFQWAGNPLDRALMAGSG